MDAFRTLDKVFVFIFLADPGKQTLFSMCLMFHHSLEQKQR